MQNKNWYSDVIEKSPLFHTAETVGEEGAALLYPPFRRKVERLAEALDAQGLPFRLFETYRSAERQRRLFDRGATRLRSNGMHHFGVAADFVPRTGGRWNWDVPRALWLRFGELARREGLVWGGDWKRFVDCPHVQLVPVSGQKDITAGRYPADAQADAAVPAADGAKLELRRAARKSIVRLLHGIYDLADEADLSRDTMRLLNGFRNSAELKDIAP